MGITVKVSTKPVGDLGPQTARALLAGGKEILAASDVLAPKEPSPRHDEHGVGTGFARVTPTRDGYELTVGYEAFWMRIQAQHPEWHHPNGGTSEFLLTAAVGGEDALWEGVAAAARGVLGR